MYQVIRFLLPLIFVLGSSGCVREYSESKSPKNLDNVPVRATFEKVIQNYREAETFTSHGRSSLTKFYASPRRFIDKLNVLNLFSWASHRESSFTISKSDELNGLISVHVYAEQFQMNAGYFVPDSTDELVARVSDISEFIPTRRDYKRFLESEQTIAITNGRPATNNIGNTVDDTSLSTAIHYLERNSGSDFSIIKQIFASMSNDHFATVIDPSEWFANFVPIKIEHFNGINCVLFEERRTSIEAETITRIWIDKSRFLVVKFEKYYIVNRSEAVHLERVIYDKIDIDAGS